MVKVPGFGALAVRGGNAFARIATWRAVSRPLEPVSDTQALGIIISEVLSSHPAEVEAYREGKGKLIGLFIGEVMKATRGAADPKIVEGLLRERLSS